MDLIEIIKITTGTTEKILRKAFDEAEKKYRQKMLEILEEMNSKEKTVDEKLNKAMELMEIIMPYLIKFKNKVN